MKVILVRHAKAMDRVKALLKSVLDEDRPLTKKGRAKFLEHAKRNAKIFSGAELFVSSEFLRAKQTLEVLLEALPQRQTGWPVEVIKKITPDDSPEALIKWLKLRTEKKLVVVGHEPFISKFLSKAIVGSSVKSSKKSTTKVEYDKIKKGAIVCLDISFSDDHFSIKAEKIIQPQT